MRTNIDLSEELIQNALILSGLKTKKAVVNQALKEFLERQAKLQILKLQGELVWEGDLSKWRTTKYE
ncbi:type II toxin-antitoxin system VapB family antitoxin [Lacihabitans sp. CS3-21]|uniref:type II toxin-antitoxin system VapB family antitoxin n=1 Tax=Lacihabitans sp. CS3-21 TaxID=2487332 RepID=UPI0020CF583C|nr:type II toxin-antitoxin system VapB family antitoxin [Lacihabitans sp. CS3-21]MCP9745542.1 type II toxin-antitoxin system VapB family antitoxin [Lacihabitans sp. CS3-21]